SNGGRPSALSGFIGAGRSTSQFQVLVIECSLRTVTWPEASTAQPSVSLDAGATNLDRSNGPAAKGKKSPAAFAGGARKGRAGLAGGLEPRTLAAD
ncbi:MAG: hypothetical protein ACLQE9_02415, partial [Roseiarcus sp.]